MTGYGDGDSGSKEQFEEKERKRLESILRQSEQTWKRGLAENGHAEGEQGKANKANKDDAANHNPTANSSEENGQQDGMMSLLSPELRAQFSDMGSDSLIILPSKKKKTKSKSLPPLTPQEIKAAKALYKNTQRKLTQLEQRKKQKELRSGLYKQLEEHTLVQQLSNTNNAAVNSKDKNNASASVSSSSNNAINNQQAQSLLLKSSELGKKRTKKERLKLLRKKEALGIKLTKEEMDLLYVKYDAPNSESFPETFKPSMAERVGNVGAGKKLSSEGDDTGLEDTSSKKKHKEKKKKRRKGNPGDGEDNEINDDGDDVMCDADGGKKNCDEVGQTSKFCPKKARLEPTTSVSIPDKPDPESPGIDVQGEEPAATSSAAASKGNDYAESDDTATATGINPKQSFSQMMFASLTSLKSKTDTRNAELASEQEKREQQEAEEKMKLEKEERKHRKVYVPSETPLVSTKHLLDEKSANNNISSVDKSPIKGAKKHNIVQHINRPADIEESRYDLPVSAMEYEIIDAVRSKDCTILCGETGSGKSTQVPQFLYESGFSVNKKVDGDSIGDNNQSNHLLIGITQPRRVAAISTAKRVCYEMGHGNGQTISNNNLVAYQTRYESAGLGPKTHVKFMTDGILLQEIQSDLLLRKYGAIVIDEAHERNLNTDVLLGLLSKSLPLRRKAAEEGTLPPLKLMVMSATLRVEDFLENERLFPRGEGESSESSRPVLVKVPGRTFPVSIHHSKVTELDDYEKVAMEKVCKIHRKLPSGGILVFLTGKQEIVRCINRLNQRLEPRCRGKRSTTGRGQESEGVKDVDMALGGDAAVVNGSGGFRDMDDEEADGDLFQKAEDGEGYHDDFDVENNESDDIDIADDDGNDDDKRPKKVRILPLYSMLSADEQAKVFAPVPEDTRLIVVATNIAETSITIPGISYVVDSGRQKCRNYHANTGVASYDIMWISKAAADQRAGRAGRTGPGHCYRLYSSSVYSRYLDEFALPEVLTRPLEDVVLAMKAMNVMNVTSFPFVTPPGQGQINAAVRLLSNLGCVDISRVEEQGGDGRITPLGEAVAKLPLGVRYGKMLLVAAQANILDYGICLVAVLSESTLFVCCTEEITEKDKAEKDSGTDLNGMDKVDRYQTLQREKQHKRELKAKWMHDGGDVLSAVKAAGAYAYAGRGAGGNSEKLACRQFCEENGLHLVAMQRVAKMRLHLCKLAMTRLPQAGGIAAETGKYLSSMPPPKRIQECLLRQAIASGLLDNIARRAPPGVLPAEFTGVPRSAYICANSKLKEPLFIDNKSTVHSKRPEWICYDSIVRKTKKDGTTIATMQRVTPIDPDWLALLCHGSNLMTLGTPLATPMPRYIKEKDSIQCAVKTKFGGHGWEIPPCYVDMYEAIQRENKRSDQRKIQNSAAMIDDSFRWFARYLLEGKIFPELLSLLPMLNDEPTMITRRKPTKKVLMIVSALSDAGVDSASALQKHWSEKDNKFLFKALKPWVKQNHLEDVKRLWIAVVNSNVNAWKNR